MLNNFLLHKIQYVVSISKLRKSLLTEILFDLRLSASDILKGIEFSFNVLIETCERKQINSVMQTSKKVILSLTSQVTAELVIKFHLAIDKNAKNKTQLHCL